MWVNCLECVVKIEPVAELMSKSPTQIEQWWGTASNTAIKNDSAIIYGIVIVHDRKCRIKKAFLVTGETVIYK